MIAELVTTVALLAESPRVAAASPSLPSSTSRVSRISRRGARWAICLASPSWPRGAEPDQALDVEREALVERAQPALGAELEERVGLQARLLGLAVLAGAGGGLHAVEREPDQVVVGLVGLLGPGLRHRGLQRGLGLGGDLLDLLVGRRRRTSAWRRSRRAGRARSAPPRPASVRALSRLASWSRRSPKAPTAPVRNATASVISKSRVTWSPLTPRPYSTGTSDEELQQLLGAPRGLLGRERRGGEALERARRRGRARRRARRRPRAAPRRRPRPAARRPRRGPPRSAARGSRSSPRPGRRPRRGARGGSARCRGGRRRAARAGAPGRRRAGPSSTACVGGGGA